MFPISGSDHLRLEDVCKGPSTVGFLFLEGSDMLQYICMAKQKLEKQTDS